MIIDKKLLQDIAHLARLEFQEEDEQEMLAEMNKILDWMNQLNEVDTSDVAPLIHLSEETNVLRNDEPAPSLDHEAGLKNAPKRDSNYFRVPKVIE